MENITVLDWDVTFRIIHKKIIDPPDFSERIFVKRLIQSIEGFPFENPKRNQRKFFGNTEKQDCNENPRALRRY